MGFMMVRQYLATIMVCLLSVAWRGSGKVTEDTVWLLEDYYGSHDNYDVLYTGCSAVVLVLSNDKLHLDAYMVSTKEKKAQITLPMPALFFQYRHTKAGYVLVVAHERHMTISDKNQTTISLHSIDTLSSLFLIDDLACVTSANTTNILCVNINTRKRKLCYDNIPPGSRGYTNEPTDSFPNQPFSYIVTPDHKTIMTFKVVDNCVSFVGTVSGRNYGNNMWLSNNGSRVFLSNGLSLNSPSLSPNNTLGYESVGEHTYTSVSQVCFCYLGTTSVCPDVYRPIVSLREDVVDQVFFFTWPDLAAHGARAIPSPDGYRIVRPITVEYFGPNCAYVLAVFQRIQDGALVSGVAYLIWDDC